MSTVARFTLLQYDRMVASGALAGRPLELIEGEIREMGPIGPLHEELVDRLVEWSHQVLPPSAVRLRVQQSIGLPGLESAPQPDLAWVVPRNYSRHRPTAADVFLLIEVGDTSLDFDVGEKAALYATADVCEYWVVHAAARKIEVFRKPVDGQYRDRALFAGDQQLRPTAFPEAILVPEILWSGA